MGRLGLSKLKVAAWLRRHLQRRSYGVVVKSRLLTECSSKLFPPQDVFGSAGKVTSLEVGHVSRAVRRMPLAMPRRILTSSTKLIAIQPTLYKTI